MKGPEDDDGLTGKVAILLARAGTKVPVADLDQKLAERTVEMISDRGRHGGGTCRRRHQGNRMQAIGLPSTAGAGSTSSTTMSASAAAAASSTRSPRQYRRVMQVNVETMFLLSSTRSRP